MPPQATIQVLITLYEGVDILDFVGPAEFLSLVGMLGNSSPNTPTPFKVTITSRSELTTTAIGVKVARQLSLEDAYARLEEFDILLVPGGSSRKVLDGNTTEPMALISAFASLPPRPGKDRIIMSVCTGALFLAKAGVLGGQTVVTNSGDMDRLREMVAGSDTIVADGAERFVVNPSGGMNGAGKQGYRIMTSRGPGAGLDLSLWLVEYFVGQEARKGVEDLVEYQGRLDEGLVL